MRQNFPARHLAYSNSNMNQFKRNPMKFYLQLISLILLTFLASCAGPASKQDMAPKEAPVTSPKPVPEESEAAKPASPAAPVSASTLSVSTQQAPGKSSWAVRDGWAYKDGQKFFAVGVWNIPGYKRVRKQSDDSPRNMKQFSEAATLFNLIQMQSGYEQAEYMQSEILLTGVSKIKWRFLKGFTGPESWRPDRNNNGRLDYEEMKRINNNLDAFYSDYIRQNVAAEIEQRFRAYDKVWFLSDEPDAGGAGWCWDPRVVESYHQALKTLDGQSLTYIDLFGSIRGSRYLFEQNYIGKFGALPDRLPVGTDAQELEGDPQQLQSYMLSADGTKAYNYSQPAGKWQPQRRDQFRNKYYDNVYETARGYRNASDVIGVNCYAEFHDYPAAAGIVIDAIRAACGPDKPIWNFFDGAAWAKGRNESFDDYLKSVRAQIYISIVHGASGVLFWTARDKTNQEFWTKIEELTRELQQNTDLITSPILRFEVQGDVHYAEYELRNGETAVIAVNASRQTGARIRLPRIGIQQLAPLQVLISGNGL